MSADSDGELRDELADAPELGPAAAAAAFVKHPEMYVGSPPSHDRMVAFISGFDTALFMAGEPSSLMSEHWEAMEPQPSAGPASPELERQRIQALKPALEAVFTAAARLKDQRSTPPADDVQ